MSFLHRIRILFGLFLLATASEAEVLTLEEATDLAVNLRNSENHLQKVHLSKIKEAEIGISASNAGYLPTVGVNAASTTKEVGAELSLNQPLWQGGRVSKAVELSHHQKKITELEFKMDALALSKLVTDLYLNSYVLNLKIKKINEKLLLMRDIFERFKIASGARLVSKDDVLSFEMAISKTEIDFSEMKSRLEMLIDQIQQVTGRNDVKVEMLRDPFVYDISKVFQSSMDIYLESHPKIQVLDAEIQRMEIEKQRDLSQSDPTLSLQLGYRWGDSFKTPGITKTLQPFGVIGFSWLLFDRFRTSYIKESYVEKIVQKNVERKVLADSIRLEFSRILDRIRYLKKLSKDLTKTMALYSSRTADRNKQFQYFQRGVSFSSWWGSEQIAQDTQFGSYEVQKEISQLYYSILSESNL